MTLKGMLIGFSITALVPAILPAQTSFDNSGNSLLHGTYFIREVWYGNLTGVNQIGEAASLTGTITFNNGTYTIAAQVSDNTVAGGSPQPLSSSGS